MPATGKKRAGPGGGQELGLRTRTPVGRAGKLEPFPDACRVLITSWKLMDLNQAF